GQVGARHLSPRGAVRYLQVINIRDTGIDFAVKPDRVAEGSQNDPERSRIRAGDILDRKSTRLNSSHVSISYAVFCLKKKITPPTSSRLDGAQNISLIGVGHNAILADPCAQRRIVALIRSEQSLATTEASTSVYLASV